MFKKICLLWGDGMLTNTSRSTLDREAPHELELSSRGFTLHLFFNVIQSTEPKHISTPFTSTQFVTCHSSCVVDRIVYTHSLQTLSKHNTQKTQSTRTPQNANKLIPKNSVSYVAPKQSN